MLFLFIYWCIDNWVGVEWWNMFSLYIGRCGVLYLCYVVGGGKMGNEFYVVCWGFDVGVVKWMLGNKL